jgi:hypothetical protein
MMTPEQLALMRLRVVENHEGDVMFGRDEVAALLDHADTLQDKITRLVSATDQYQAQIAHALKEMRDD